MNSDHYPPDFLFSSILRRTKIIATLGPASDNPRIIKEMIASGMDIARLNLSHGEESWHRETVMKVRSVAKEMNREIGNRKRAIADRTVLVYG